MESWLWIPVSVLAALSQTVRTGMQKHLTAALTTQSVTLVRFLFGLPFAAVYLLALMNTGGRDLPAFNGDFLLSCLAAGLAQILATALLIHLFSLRNFAVGSTYARTESFQTAVLGSLFFGEVIVLAGWLAIAVSVGGVLVMTIGRTGATLRIVDRSMAVGLVSGACFALASLFIRRASLSLGLGDFLYSAALTLVTMVIIQTVVLGAWIIVREPAQFAAMARSWRACLVVGLTSAIGSASWFTAMTVQKASYVKALGQVEFVFTLLVSVYIFRERPSGVETGGMALVVAGIVVLLAFG